MVSYAARIKGGGQSAAACLWPPWITQVTGWRLDGAERALRRQEPQERVSIAKHIWEGNAASTQSQTNSATLRPDSCHIRKCPLAAQNTEAQYRQTTIGKVSLCYNVTKHHWLFKCLIRPPLPITHIRVGHIVRNRLWGHQWFRFTTSQLLSEATLQRLISSGLCPTAHLSWSTATARAALLPQRQNWRLSSKEPLWCPGSCRLYKVTFLQRPPGNWSERAIKYL